MKNNLKKYIIIIVSVVLIVGGGVLLYFKNKDNKEETKEIMFGECKYTNKPMDIDILLKLEEKARLVEWHNDNRNERYILFSISGYTDKLKEVCKNREDVILTQAKK